MIRTIILLLIGCFIFGCVSKAPIETPKSEKLDFNNNLNRLIKQLGDYDYKKQESAYQEILSIADKIVKSTASNPEYDAPELDYLISALEYASKNGCPPDSGSAVNAAIQIRAEKLYNSIKYSAIIHPDLIKLYPEIIVHLQKGEEKKIMDWLSGQPEDVQKKGIQLYRYFSKLSNSAVWHNAIRCLIKLGGIKHILPLLVSNDVGTRMGIISIIKDMGDQSVIPYLFPLLKHKDETTRMAAMRTILGLGGTPIIKDVLPMVDDTDSAVITEMVSFISRLKDKSSARDLFPLLKHKNEWLRQEATEVILRWGGSPAIKDVILVVGDDKPVLSKIEGFITTLSDKSCVNDLLPLLQHEDVGIRLAAIDKISHLEDKSAIRHFIPLLKDDSPEIREKVLWFLLDKFQNKIDESDKLVVKDIIPLLKDKDANIRSLAINVIVVLGGLRTAISDILPLLKDNDAQVKGFVVGNLCNLHDKSLIPHFITLLHDDDQYIRVSAIQALVYLNVPEKYPLIQELLSLVKDNYWVVKLMAVETLILIGDEAIINKHQIIDQLVPLFVNEQYYPRCMSMLLACKLDAIYIVKNILPLLKDSDNVKLAAACALTQLNDVRAIPIWIEYIDERKTLEYIKKGVGYAVKPINYLADEGLRELSGKIMESGLLLSEKAKLWKEWWEKEGKAWYEEEVKKIATTDEHR